MVKTYFQNFNRLDAGETEITVEYSATGGCAAQTYGDPSGCWPAEAPEVEIIGAWLEDGTKVQLTQEEDEKFSLWLMENHEDDDDRDEYWEI